MSGIYEIPAPANEPVYDYAPGSPEREKLKQELERVASERVEIPVVAGDEEIRTGDTTDVVMPHDHQHVLATAHKARRQDVNKAIDKALEAKPKWEAMPFEERASIFMRAADMLTGPYRARLNACCMLGQGKTPHQAEIEGVCELVDFFRFNTWYAQQIYREQPPIQPKNVWNRVEYRPLEGFVLAVTPFNFLAIALNLPTSPAIMGNVALWKPASQTLRGCWFVYNVLRECGLPEGVINLLPGDGPEQGEAALDSEHLAGVHFTGSVGTFRSLWKGTAERIERYRSWPRIVGETGGKDFIVAHPSADMKAVATAIIRGGYEYQGQKCSAVSRVYIPKSMWPELRDAVVSEIGQIKMGDVRDFSNFMGAVIDERAFDKIDGYLKVARDSATVLAGGNADKSNGWFVEPTFVQVDDPKHQLMQEEIFGPVVAAYVYDDTKWSETLDLVNETSPYGLTGAVFANERHAVIEAEKKLSQAAGNFYINDKPTGSIVGQQPFGGARASGTNDKAGSMWNLTRWVSPRAIKENFVSPTDWRYPYMG
jgi:1-pyrroline-5-carboxylate dehydrogenase